MNDQKPEKEKPEPGIKEIPVNPELPAIDPVPKERPVQKPEEPVIPLPEITPQKEKPGESSRNTI